MDRAQIVEYVRISLSEVLEEDIAEITEDARLFEDLGLDSTSAIELLMAIEDTTGLETDLDDLDPELFRTVGGVVSFIEAGLSAATAAAR
ncbi:acyl carrier protein [Actinokineospora sp.]|uniref:acyl carrier protein n=1 Tax=Actinokineospora sp. TaxID=1872133 RepID=UPI004037A353